jgi:thiol-disulfide isomerase/thioredoxin
VLLATVAAALATALVVSLLVDGDEQQEPAGDVITLQTGDPEGGFPTGQDLSGTQAPEVDVEALRIDGVDAGEDIALTAHRDGRPMVLNFFGSWCAPCVQEMPDLQSVSREFAAADVVFLGLAERDSVDDALTIVDRTGVTYEIGRDPGGAILTAFEGLAMPITVFIAADGTITSVHSGALSAADLRSRINAELL